MCITFFQFLLLQKIRHLETSQLYFHLISTIFPPRFFQEISKNPIFPPYFLPGFSKNPGNIPDFYHQKMDKNSISPTFSAKIRQNLPGLRHGIPRSQVARHVTSVTTVTTSTRAEAGASPLAEQSSQSSSDGSAPVTPKRCRNVAGPGRGFLKLFFDWDDDCEKFSVSIFFEWSILERL